MNSLQLKQIIISNLLGNRYELNVSNSDKQSKYFEKTNSDTSERYVVRVSNHCSNKLTWQQKYLGDNDNHIYTNCYDIVIFEPDIDGVQKCNFKDERFVVQYVYNTVNKTEKEIRKFIDSINFHTELINY
jgi:hypothetical protein